MTCGSTMIRRLLDPANAITAAGLALSVIAVHLAARGAVHAAVAVALWALLADHLDGVVAARTPGRAQETARIGKSLDSLADLVSAGVLPGVVLLTVAGGAVWATGVSIALVIASALRLSYFNTHGLSGNRFTGVPTTYVLPVVAAILLLEPLLAQGFLAPILGAALFALALLHVSALQVPRTSGVMYLAVTLYCAGASVILAAR